MIDILKKGRLLLLKYSPEYLGNGWVVRELESKGEVTFNKAFTVLERDLHGHVLDSLKQIEDIDSIEFVIGRRVGSFFKIEPRILGIKNTVRIHKDFKIRREYFVAYRNISVFKVIDRIYGENIYIGGDGDGVIPSEIFNELIAKFPNSYELDKYAKARVTAVLRDYIEGMVDCEKSYNEYMNKKVSMKNANIRSQFKEYEINKYRMIAEEIEEMLANEVGYSEKDWQKKILQIMLLLYPKYIAILENVQVRDHVGKNRFLDFMLVDSSGNIDVVEIKKPFDKCIVTLDTYRDNHIPLRELSGTVMQIEKYVYYLNKWGSDGERVLTNRFKNLLPAGLRIKITNPNGIIVMGRDKMLTEKQRDDFEVIKRKYKNVIDIITYDDMIARVRFVLGSL